jgi:hypothetical protein
MNVAFCSAPAAETGGRPAIKAAKHASAKSMVNAETVFNFNPRTGLVSSCGTAAFGVGKAGCR